MDAFSESECFNLITLTGRKEWIDFFRDTLGGEEKKAFHFKQTIALSKEEPVRSKVLLSKPEKIQIFVQTKSKPPIAWARTVGVKLGRGGQRVVFQTAYYNIQRQIYGVHVTKNGSQGRKEWKMGTMALVEEEGYQKLNESSHFAVFLRDHGFLEMDLEG